MVVFFAFVDFGLGCACCFVVLAVYVLAVFLIAVWVWANLALGIL